MTRRLRGLGLAGFIGLCVFGGYRLAYSRGRDHPEWIGRETARVSRTDLFVTLTAGGKVESERDTLVTCELQDLRFSSQGRSINTGGATTILSLVPEGTSVRRDDVLCRLDSSDYEELVRQQQLKVETSRADRRRAELELEIARSALVEFRDGLRGQQTQEYLGRIAMAEADLTRQGDRTAWSDRMLDRRYIAASQAAVERHERLRAEVVLASARRAYSAFLRFQSGATLRGIECQIEAAETNLAFEKIRLGFQETQLENFRRQVDGCTVRAPHDGFLIYAAGPDGVVRIEEGARVRQKQNLFRLPDLGRMEVRALLHESIVDRVREGMRATVRIEALSSRTLEGHVTSIAPLPIQSRNPMASNDVKNYEGRVVLDASPAGLRPGMSAEVRIETERRPDVLVIPASALSVEDGLEVCYVAGPGGVERREVEVGPATADLLEVGEGLEEGERVVLDPDAEPAPPDESPAPTPPAD